MKVLLLLFTSCVLTMAEPTVRTSRFLGIPLARQYSLPARWSNWQKQIVVEGELVLETGMPWSVREGHCGVLLAAPNLGSYERIFQAAIAFRPTRYQDMFSGKEMAPMPLGTGESGGLRLSVAATETIPLIKKIIQQRPLPFMAENRIVGLEMRIGEYDEVVEFLGIGNDRHLLSLSGIDKKGRRIPSAWSGSDDLGYYTPGFH